jgi:hypothetical protein
MIAEGKAAASKQGPAYSNGGYSDRMPTSISGGGASRSNTNTPKKDFNCYKCGQAGHMARNCPGR